MVQLPYDIWEKIALHLKAIGLLWSYRSLNSAFYHAALKERYSSIRPNFVHLRPGQNWHRFFGFDDQVIAKHVRRISFASDDALWRDSTPGEGTVLLSGIRLKVKKLFNPKQGPYQRITKTIEGFENVSSLSLWLHIPHCLLPQNSLNIFKVTLRICSNSLTTLSLSISRKLLPEVLQHDVYFPHLAVIGIEERSLDSPPPTGINGVIVPFLNRHRLPLKTIVLLAHNDNEYSPVIVGLDHFPSLRGIGISISPSGDFTPTIRLLTEYSAVLEQLYLKVVGEGTFQAILNIFKDVKGPFPKLQYLHIANFAWLESDYDPNDKYLVGEAVNFICRLSSSLVTLLLFQEVRLTRESFFNIFDLPKHMGYSYVCMQKLAIDVDEFTPGMMDLLASRLPALQELDIGIGVLKPRHGVPGFREDALFVAEVLAEVRRGGHDYSQWKLQTINLRGLLFLSVWDDRLSNSVGYGFVIITELIPSLETFNDLPAKEFIASLKVDKNMKMITDAVLLLQTRQ